MFATTPAPESIKPARASTTASDWRWYHGIIFYIIIQSITFGLSGLVSAIRGSSGKSLREDFFGNPSYFNDLNQSIFAPPSWVFAPAWTINNIAVIWGNLRVLNRPEKTSGRDTFLVLQAASWLNYVVFNAAYFSLRSPINAFILTLSMFLLTIASGFVAIFRLKDSRAALSLATLFTWLIIALTAATFQALWNHDDFYDAGPFVAPNPALLKKQR
ncbi:MAG TPA: TspO/MBR family protein [Ktedonobacteraceae bacterium]|nr:TspO/MBR family protein [Ktedonobacteraceae bacterium]